MIIYKEIKEALKQAIEHEKGNCRGKGKQDILEEKQEEKEKAPSINSKALLCCKNTKSGR